MDVNQRSVSMRYKAARVPADQQMRILLDADFHRTSAGARRDHRMGQLLGTVFSLNQVYAAEVVVNLFDGGPNSDVVCRIAGHSAVRLQRDERPDPYIEGLLGRFEEERKQWVQVQPSAHIWVGRLPENLRLGVHTITVSATDEYGRQHTGRKIFEVTSSR